MNLANLPFPNVIEELKYDEILSSVKSLFKSYLNADEIALLESDNYSALLETLAYRELLLRARINHAVKSMLLPFASGSDLDNVVSIYGIKRLKGERPSASFEFSLSMVQDSDVVIPQGVILGDGKEATAELISDAIIKKGEPKTTGMARLNLKAKSSDIRCEYIQTPLPFVLKAKQLGDFSGGSDKESDEAFRKRALLSLERFSTAGAAKAYEFHALSASAKVKEATAINGGAGIVNLYIKTTDMSEITKNNLQEYLNDQTKRPLTDKVVVMNATVKNIEVIAQVELLELLRQDEVDKKIKANLAKELALGEDLNISYLYHNIHTDGVYRAKITAPLVDTKASQNEFIKISSIKLSYKKADL